MSGATLSQDVIGAIVDLAKVNPFVRPEVIATLAYSAVLLGKSRRCSGHTATTARATMIPTETSMNLCKAMLHGAAKRGIRTMMVRVMLA